MVRKRGFALTVARATRFVYVLLLRFFGSCIGNLRQIGDGYWTIMTKVLQARS